MFVKVMFGKIIALILVLTGIFFFSKSSPRTDRSFPAPKKETKAGAAEAEVVADNLRIPWEVAFLPGGEILLTERRGNLIKIDAARQIIPIAGVAHIGEGGLLGMALHPKFSVNHWLYLYLTSKSGAAITNRVERYRLEGNRLFERTLIIDGIAGAAVHDGGRLAFGPDGYLYITTGDAGAPQSAQDTNSLNGKILRLEDDGSLPPDNPFGNAVYSFGHRNPQGLAWDGKSRLWATEHGRSGLQSGLDELNLIKKGGNYGWPVIQGDASKEGLISPILHSGEETTWAPAGAAFWEGRLFFAGLRGETLYEAKIGKNPVVLKTHFAKKFGRLRAIAVGPDGFLYLTTSNQDGRGKPQKNDDKLIKVDPKKL